MAALMPALTKHTHTHAELTESITWRLGAHTRTQSHTSCTERHLRTRVQKRRRITVDTC